MGYVIRNEKYDLFFKLKNLVEIEGFLWGVYIYYG